MKKQRKLSLRRETLRSLRGKEMDLAKGGTNTDFTLTCWSVDCTADCHTQVNCGGPPPAPSEPCQIFLSEVICGP